MAESPNSILPVCCLKKYVTDTAGYSDARNTGNVTLWCGNGHPIQNTPSPEKISLPCPPQWSKTSGASPTTGRSWHVLAEVTGSRNSNIFPSPAHGRENWLLTMQPSSPCRAVSTLSAIPPCLSALNVVNLTPPSDLAAASLLVVGYCFFLSFTSQLKWCHSLPSSHWSPISRTPPTPPPPRHPPSTICLAAVF